MNKTYLSDLFLFTARMSKDSGNTKVRPNNLFALEFFSKDFSVSHACIWLSMLC